MSYTANETAGKRPIELYQFGGDTDYYRYTDAAEPQTYLGATYQPATIKRGPIQQTKELNKANIKLTVPRDNDFAALFIATTPDSRYSLTIFRQHDGASDLITYWKGRVMSVEWQNANATIQCEPLTTALKRAGLRPRYQTLCRHALYDAGCRAVPSDFRVDDTVGSVSGDTISAGAWGNQPDGWFTGGYVKYLGVQRLIVSHSGAALTLSAPIPGLAIGARVEAYAGCDHSVDTCAAKFDNLVNHGGFPYVPAKNPFGQNGAG